MKEVRGCELCSSPARVHCESDQASLCWNCDAKVHGANFLVARHPRSLLCRSCYSPTPWMASGPKLGSTMSLCQRCGADRTAPRGGPLKLRPAVDPPEEICAAADGEPSSVNNEEIDADDDYSDDQAEDEEDRDVVVEDEAENQVVPLSFTPPLSGAPTASSSEQERNSDSDPSGRPSLKRSRSHSIDLNQCFEDDETASVDSETPLKERRTESDSHNE